MSSELLKKIAAGEEFDLVEGVRELARVLTEEKPLSNSPQFGERTGSGDGVESGLNEKPKAAPKPAPPSTNGTGKKS